MGIFCEINLRIPIEGKYEYRPGSIVSGGIRYYLDQEYDFTAITVSLKGIGVMYIEDRVAKTSYSNQESYVDIDSVIHTNEKHKSLPQGQYESQFSFQLPSGIPATLEHSKETGQHFARCVIKYYVRIKFETARRFDIDKRYKREINVISDETPRLSDKPLVYGNQKRLLQLSTLLSEKSAIKLKATIANSVLRPNEKVKVDYEIENATSVDIKLVEFKLLQVDKYISRREHVQTLRSIVESFKFTYGSIKGGETAKFTAEIAVPAFCASIGHSKIMERDYSVASSVSLPLPHANMLLEIPFQVIPTLSSSFGGYGASSSTAGYSNDALPTYWEAMGEEKRDAFEKDKRANAGEKEKKRTFE